MIGKKTGNAPERNLLRRRLKSVFYENALYDGVKDGIVIVYAQAKQLSFQEIETLLRKAFV